jgi:glutathione S-transferase
MTEIEIYSAVFCPYAYRSRLTLSEKKVPFKLIEIDLQNKPANFGEISPFGKVPVLDLTYYPWFEQVAVLEHFRGFQFPDELDRLKKWWKTVANRESVQAIAKSQEFYLEHYRRLLQGL